MADLSTFPGSSGAYDKQFFRLTILAILLGLLSSAPKPLFACWGPTCGDVFHPYDKWDIHEPSVADIPGAEQVVGAIVDGDTQCIMGVAGSVGGGMLCGGCLVAATGSAGAVAMACAKPCGTTAGSLTAAILKCKA
jgi:hypothetical protein